MGIFARIYSGIVQKNLTNKIDKKYKYIFYKIVDCIHENTIYVLQCINTNAIFHAKITDIVFDIDILYNLHPIQSCYIGIEYGVHATQKIGSLKPKNDNLQYRYGSYNLVYQNRNGNVCICRVSTGEEFLMDPRDIALSEKLIQEFDASRAFNIGLLAGIKMNRSTIKCIDAVNLSKYSHLKIVN